jgi:FtsZ-interacting cell division protein ZipA
MSELQLALLIIGLGVMVVVYAYGWWQQYRLSRKFGKAFKSNHGDALYHQNSGKPSSDNIEKTDVRRADATAEIAIFDSPADDLIEIISEVVSTPSLLDESCTLLDSHSDFMIELQLREPATGAVLAGFWARKFDFGKPVQVCGLTRNTQNWERVIADGKTVYVSLRIALQMVDRGGVISVTKLADFRDLVLGVAQLIQAQPYVADLSESHAHAMQLDSFCASVDQMVGINLIPSGERLVLASRIAEAAIMQEMSLQADGAFHRFNGHGLSLFSLINQDTKPFQHHTLATSSSAGITLLLDVPRVADPAVQFDLMTQVAYGLAQELQLNVVDDHRVVLSASGLERIHAQIASVEKQMLDNHIEAGSAQARRLFL